MYYPYLRGREAELRALKDLVTSGLLSSNVIPIIEPVTDKARTVKIIRDITDVLSAEQNSGQLAVVLNPGSGISSEKPGLNWCDVLNLKGKAGIIPSFILNEQAENTKFDFANTPGKTLGLVVEDSLDFLESYQGKNLLSRMKAGIIVHPDESRFISGVPRVLDTVNCPAGTVLLRDAFHKRRANAEYAEDPDEMFSTDHLLYKAIGYSGFGDYSVVGGAYDGKPGFLPYAVAIHIVYFNERQQLRIHHFVSDSNDNNKDTAGKFGEAGEKLLKWCAGRPELERTKGLTELINCVEEGAYHGLSYIKQMCIMHHLELMGSYLGGKRNVVTLQERLF